MNPHSSAKNDGSSSSPLLSSEKLNHRPSDADGAPLREEEDPFNLNPIVIGDDISSFGYHDSNIKSEFYLY